jgi:hypothetical protein
MYHRTQGRRLAILGLFAPGLESLPWGAKMPRLSRVCALLTQGNVEIAQSSSVDVACLTGALSDH